MTPRTVRGGEFRAPWSVLEFQGYYAVLDGLLIRVTHLD
jgi:hypothetical protein